MAKREREHERLAASTKNPLSRIVVAVASIVIDKIGGQAFAGANQPSIDRRASPRRMPNLP